MADRYVEVTRQSWGGRLGGSVKGVIVGLVIAFPAMVMHYKSAGTGVDPSKVNIDIQQPDLPPLDMGPPKF